jgi:hypothetical protein
MVLTRLPATEKNMSTVFYSASIKIPKIVVENSPG